MQVQYLSVFPFPLSKPLGKCIIFYVSITYCFTNILIPISKQCHSLFSLSRQVWHSHHVFKAHQPRTYFSSATVSEVLIMHLISSFIILSSMEAPIWKSPKVTYIFSTVESVRFISAPKFVAVAWTGFHYRSTYLFYVEW